MDLDNTAQLWDARTGRRIGEPLRHDDEVRGAVFSQNENQILTWSDDKTARLWDARTGRQTGRALRHDGPVNGAVFNKDGSRILTWSKGDTLSGVDNSDHTARLWDVRTGNQIGPPLRHEGPVNGAMFSKDETRILTWITGAAWLWDVSADLDLPADAVKTFIAAVTGTELNVDTRQVETIEPARWRQIRGEYERTAAAHARVCKYPQANQWLALHPDARR